MTTRATRTKSRQNAPMGSFARKSMPITWIPPPLNYKPRKQRVSYSVLTEQEKQRRKLDKYGSPQGFELFGAGIFSSPGSMSSSSVASSVASSIASSIGTWNSSQQMLTPPCTPPITPPITPPVEKTVEKKKRERKFKLHPEVPFKNKSEQRAYEEFMRVGYAKIFKNKTLFRHLERYRVRVHYHLKNKNKNKTDDNPDLAEKITETMKQDLSLIGQLYLQTIRYSNCEAEKEKYRELLQRRCENEQLLIKWRMKN